MNIGEASSVNTVVRWVLGAALHGQAVPTHEEACDALGFLLRGANKALMAGYRPEELAQGWSLRRFDRGDEPANQAGQVAILHDLATRMGDQLSARDSVLRELMQVFEEVDPHHDPDAAADQLEGARGLLDALVHGRVCRVCGCTEHTPCEDEAEHPCGWVDDDGGSPCCTACVGIGGEFSGPRDPVGVVSSRVRGIRSGVRLDARTAHGSGHGGADRVAHRDRAGSGSAGP